MLKHPYHIAVVTGDAVMLRQHDYGARIAFIDYDGEQEFHNYKNNPPKSETEELDFVKKNTPRMVNGVEKLQNFVDYLKQ